MTEFIMLVGLPGSGKSTYAESLKAKGYHIHSSDAIREELTGDVNTQDKNTEVFSMLHSRIKDDLKSGISCVYDATNMSMKRRVAFLKELKKINCIKECVLFLIPIEECKKRNVQRKRKVPDEVIDKMVGQFDVPMEYEGWDEISIETDKTISYDYPIGDTIGFDQENSHHSLTLYDHMKKSSTYIENNYIRTTNPLHHYDIMRYSRIARAAYNHDIGKLITKTFINSKGEVTKDAHYYGHDRAGAYLYLLGRVCDDYLYLENDDWYIASLINWHMRPYLGWKQSERAKERDKKLIGEKMYEDIMILHEADLAAH